MRTIKLFLSLMISCVLLTGLAKGAFPKDRFPVVVQDDLRVKIKIDRPVQRIVSLSPSHTEILFALGLGKRVVGVTEYCDYPPEAKRKKSVGGYSNPNIEEIVALRPDIIFAAHGNPTPEVDKLRKLGIPLFASNPKNLDEVLDTILRVGMVTGQRENAEKIVDNLRSRIRAIKTKTEKIKPSSKPLVFWGDWETPIFTAGPGSFIHNLIQLAGGRNLAADTNKPWPQISLETIVARDPQIIIVGHQPSEDPLKILRSKEGWRNLSAVKNGRVYYVDANIVTRPGPRLVDGLEAIAHLTHPELFPEMRKGRGK